MRGDGAREWDGGKGDEEWIGMGEEGEVNGRGS